LFLFAEEPSVNGGMARAESVSTTGSIELALNSKGGALQLTLLN
jgi:hypothetical protein